MGHTVPPHLPTDIFEPLKNLINLTLHYVYSVELPLGIIGTVPSLKHLTIAMAQYTTLGQEFLLLKNLETLRNGRIVRISDTSLGNVRKLYRLVEINHTTFAN